MSYVDLVSRYGEFTLRLTPVVNPHDPEATERPTWEARLFNQGLDATIVSPEEHDESQTLVEYFNEIAAEHRGWDGKKEWQSRFGALKIVSDHDQVNAVRLYVQLTGGVLPQWVVNAELHLDPGRFHRVGANLELFSKALHGEAEADDAPARISPHRSAGQTIRRADG